MNKLLLLFAGVSTAGLVLVGTFVTAAAMRGADLSTLPVVGTLFPEPTEASIDADVEEPMAAIEDEVRDDRRTPVQVIESAASPLQAFLLPTPWNASDLEQLEQALQNRMAELDLREDQLEERERQLAESQRHLADLQAELENVRTGLIEERDETDAVREQTEREKEAEAARRVADLRRMSNIFSEGDAEESSRMLLDTYTPEQVGIVLSGLTAERVRELLQGIQTVDSSALVDVEASYRKHSAQ